MAENQFAPITLEELIPRNQLLERCPWISPQQLNRWRKDGLVRVFWGDKGMPVYAKSDIEQAIAADMERDREKQAEEEAIECWA